MSYLHAKTNDLKYPFSTTAILRAAKRLKIKTEVIDKKFGYFFLLRLGRHQEYIIANRIPLNDIVAHQIARDKVYAYMLFEKYGFNIPEGDYFFRRNFCSNYSPIRDQGRRQALLYADRLGYPVVIKVNNLGAGQDVYLVRNKKQLNKKLSDFFKKDYIAIIQRPVSGREYRLVVLDGEVHIAYEKISSSFCKNLSLGARASDQTEVVHEFYQHLTKRICRLFNLRVYGLDIIMSDIKKPDKNYCLLEINSMLGLEHFYRLGGKKRVDAFYEQVLKRMFF